MTINTKKIIRLIIFIFVLLLLTTYYFIAKSNTQDQVIKFCENASYIKQYNKILEILPKETGLREVLIGKKPNELIILRSKVIPANPIYNPIYRCTLSFDEEGVLKSNLVHKIEFKIWAD